MKAITVEPGKPGTARLEDVPEPEVRDGSVLVEAVAVGSAGPTSRSSKGNMAGRLRERHAWCWGMNHSGASLIQVQTVH